MTKISFKKFAKIDSEKFKSLNLEWLNSYFEVETIDKLVLNNPKTEIIDKGGFIFMIQKNSETIGTFAFIKKNEKIYEFSCKCQQGFKGALCDEGIRSKSVFQQLRTYPSFNPTTVN